MAALALTVFAIAEAQGDSGADLSIRLSGSNAIITTENREPTPNTEAGVTMGVGIAKGSGSATFQVRVTFDAPLPSANCPQELPFGADIPETNLYLTYNDGSILELFSDSGSLCGNGTLFIADVQGTVSGGEGRFDGATGTWSAAVEQDGGRLTGDVEVDLF
jgi:hypothetical protein